jgi:hypothetical protein
VSKGGFVRSFYEVLKGATQTGTVQKMFITGVTPITLDSLSSGFNIVKHITYRKEFNDLAGFTQQEVDYSLEESIFKRCEDIDKKALLNKVKIWYNGYLFNGEANERIYNATLLNYFITEYNFDKCKMPPRMLDSNVASDYKAIMKLFNIGDSERNYKILEELIEKGTVTGVIKDRYDLSREFSEEDFITLIYSMGFITIKDEIVAGLYKFEIPNYVIKMLYFNYFAIELERRNQFKITKSIGKILTQLLLGDIEPFKYEKIATQPDVLATVLDLIGLDLSYPILGHSIFSDDKQNISLMQFHTAYAFRVDDEVAIIRPNKKPLTFLYENKHLVATSHNEELEKDALAFVITLDNLYQNKLYK